MWQRVRQGVVSMADYVLPISAGEVQRYRMMAQTALETEGELLALAGVAPGATVADVGCGPAAMSVALAGLVEPDGKVIGVERDPASLDQARQVVAAAGVDNVELRAGEATATGLPTGGVDVAVMRHVLAHNGGSEQAIVNHLAELVRPGGSVYLVDVDLTGLRMRGSDPELADLGEKYVEFHASKGNDVGIGLRLDELLLAAGLEVSHFSGQYVVVDVPATMRPPSWVARESMRAAGVCSQADIDRWSAAFERQAAAGTPVRLFSPLFVGIGRR